VVLVQAYCSAMGRMAMLMLTRSMLQTASGQGGSKGGGGEGGWVHGWVAGGSRRGVGREARRRLRSLKARACEAQRSSAGACRHAAAQTHKPPLPPPAHA
jgi:hypothetical protein